MEEPIKFFVGLDVHKDSVSVAACDASREPARFVGTLGPDVNKLLKVLAKAGAPAEAGSPTATMPTAPRRERPGSAPNCGSSAPLNPVDGVAAPDRDHQVTRRRQR